MVLRKGLINSQSAQSKIGARGVVGRVVVLELNYHGCPIICTDHLFEMHPLYFIVRRSRRIPPPEGNSVLFIYFFVVQFELFCHLWVSKRSSFWAKFIQREFVGRSRSILVGRVLPSACLATTGKLKVGYFAGTIHLRRLRKKHSFKFPERDRPQCCVCFPFVAVVQYD